MKEGIETHCCFRTSVAAPRVPDHIKQWTTDWTIHSVVVWFKDRFVYVRIER